MAFKFPAKRDKKVKLPTIKGHGKTWSCDIHGEPIKFCCKEHKIPLCHLCAFKDHQKPCHLDNIGDVTLELGRKLDDKRLEIKEMNRHLHNLDSKIHTCSADARNHLRSIDGATNATFESKLKSVTNKKLDKIRSINEEADEDIRKINEKREKRIKSCNEEAERQQLTIKENQAKVLLEAKEINEVVSKKIQDIKSKNQQAISTMNNVDTRIKRIKQDYKTLVNEAPQVLASLDENLSLIVHQDVSDCLDQIQRQVQMVKFVEGEVGGQHFGRIDGYIGKWELVKSIRIPSIVNEPVLCGLISGNEICTGGDNNFDTYVTSISTEHTKLVNDDILTCAPVDSYIIASEKWMLVPTGDSLNGCITLYDRQWNVIRRISIPKNNISDDTSVYVDVDRDGMILAAQKVQSNIYVINPVDGKIVNTITMQGKVVWGEVQALSSGDIVVKTFHNEFTVISRSGENKAVIQCDEWRVSWCCADKLTDTLYITYWDDERNIIAVDQVSCDGIFQARRIVEYESSPRCEYTTNPSLVTPSGNLVVCDEKKLLVYNNRFIV